MFDRIIRFFVALVLSYAALFIHLRGKPRGSARGGIAPRPAPPFV